MNLESTGDGHGHIFDLIQRCAPLFLKVGGGYLRQEKPTRQVSPEEVQEMVAMYRSGLTHAEIGKAMKVDVTRVGTLLRAHGVKGRTHSERRLVAEAASQKRPSRA